MIRSMLPLAVGFLLVAACETAPAPGPDPTLMGEDEPAISPPPHEPCGDRPLPMMPGDPPRQTGAPTSNGDPIE